jgi:hypothetical protein
MTLQCIYVYIYNIYIYIINGNITGKTNHTIPYLGVQWSGSRDILQKRWLGLPLNIGMSFQIFPRGDHQSDSWEERLKLCLDMLQLQLTMVSSSKYVSTSGVLEVWGTPQTKQV